MKVLDLFSGIGGFSLGLERVGMETVAFCESDKTCKKVLTKHWPNKIIFDDINSLKCTKRDGRIRLEADFLASGFKKGLHLKKGELIDVVCGGFPCQDVSIAGNKKGFKDEQGKRTRSGLWEEFARVIKEVGPRFVIAENVANLRSQGLGQVLKDLWSLGYDSEWHILPATAFGACHRRERIFIIGRKASDTHMSRLWRSPSSKEEARRWWTEISAGFSSMFEQKRETQPTICGGDDGFPARMDRPRRERIKQLGNAVVPAIAEFIGRSIMHHYHHDIVPFVGEKRTYRERYIEETN